MCRTNLSLLHQRASTPNSVHCNFPHERKRLRQLFKVMIPQDLSRRCDLPSPGIHLLEFLKFTELPGLLGQQFFSALDADEDGQLDQIEFTDGFLRLYRGCKSETFQLLFNVLDFNRKGFLTYADMKAVMSYLPQCCPKCKMTLARESNMEEKIAECFSDCAVISYEASEKLLEMHEDILDEILEALLNSLPPVFDEAMGRTTTSLCDDVACSPLGEPSCELKPLKLDGLKALYNIRNGALYRYRGSDRNNIKRVTLLKDLFVHPLNEVCFELKNAVISYVFEAETADQRDIWVEQIQTAKKYRWYDDYYDTKEKLGSGAYGQVLKAVSRENGQIAAVKIISKETLPAKLESRLRREIDILRFVYHPNLLHLLDVFETCERIYLVTEYIDGGTLYEWMEERHFSVSEDFTRSIVRDVATSLIFLHENGIIHRDLKLENIMLKLQHGSLPKAVLIDFGLSCFLGPYQTTDDSVGTLKYVAPEVLSRIQYREKIDSWSLGVVLYILLVGKVPFYGKTDQEIALRILKHRVKYNGDKWAGVNPLAIEVVAGLLTRKVENRWTLQDVLKSQWVSQGVEVVEDAGTKERPLKAEEFNTLEALLYA